MSLPDGITFRRAVGADLPACEEIWRDGLNDYLLPLGQMEIPPDNANLRQMHVHMLATDPDLFWVATLARGENDDPASRAVVAFAAAVRRGPVWFLSMLFVRPDVQSGGLGRKLLQHILPPDDVIRSVATDAAQPVSNGLYAAVGMAARMPMFNVVGRPVRRELLDSLPPGLIARQAGEVRPGEPGPSVPDARAAAELAALDSEVLGFEHPEDHDLFGRQGRIRFDYRDPTGRLAGYGYTSAIGRIGPIAARDAAHLAPIIAHLIDAVPPRGASAAWIPGHASATLQMLIGAGLRIEGFPVLLGWSQPFADFARYVPASPGLL